jgi:selT/selW/selH-like putative selenoprotein
VAELQNRFGSQVECTLVKGDRGVFDVTADGQLIYSKSETGRFPQLGEVADEIQARLP